MSWRLLFCDWIRRGALRRIPLNEIFAERFVEIYRTQKKMMQPSDLKILPLESLPSNYKGNLRYGQTPLFPHLEDFTFVSQVRNCRREFGRVYQLGKVVSKGGASGADIVQIEVLDEARRVRRSARPVDSFPLIAKVATLDPRNYIRNVENFRDVVVGSRLNLLVHIATATGFSRTVDWFTCHDVEAPDRSEFKLYIIMDDLDEDILPVVTGSPDPYMFKGLLAQLLANLEVAQEMFGFVHNDLHSRNVMLAKTRRTRMREAEIWEIGRPGGEKLRIRRSGVDNYELKLIDFGRSRLHTPNFSKLDAGLPTVRAETLYLPGLEHLGITERFNKSYDMRRFSIDFTLHIVEKTRTVTPQGNFNYFTELRKSAPAAYTQLVDVLSAMSGHSHITLYGDMTDVEKAAWERSFKVMPKVASQKQVRVLLSQFKKGGIAWLIDNTVYDNPRNMLYILTFMWIFTGYDFPASPTTVLDMPFFNELRETDEGDAVFMMGYNVSQGMEIALDYQSADRLCHVCLEPGRIACDCEEVIYCSEECADLHHKHHVVAECRLALE